MSENKKNEDLDELLDSALQDFDKTESKKQDSQSVTAAEAGTSQNDGEPLDAEAFFQEHAKLLADRMKTLFGGPETPSGDAPPLPQYPDKVLAGFKKVAEATCMTLEGTNPATDEEVATYSDSIAQALKGLQEGTDNISAFPEDNPFLSMVEKLSIEDNGEGDNNTFLPFLEAMMQNLLSAEILLPSIKELLEKYPAYLEENADKLSAEDKERYEKQLELYKVIEGHLESENPSDAPSVKRERFRIVLDDMRKLQDYGAVPEGMYTDTFMDFPNLDELNQAAAGGAAGGPQCPTM